ncbi:UNVERIFIED_CONTAM: hypothetical protein Sindi_0500100 [Sesamum indicum]
MRKRAGSRHLKGVFRVPERHGNRTGSVGPGQPTLGTNAAERFRVTCKVAPRAARYLGQHLSCEWVIEASTPRPRDPTHGTRYRVLAVHGGPLAKMSGRGATPHCAVLLGRGIKDGHDEGVRQGCPECALDMRRALRAHAERRNAEAERGCSLPSRDASAGSEIVGETHGGRLASRGRPLRDAKACVPRASANMGILDRRAQRHAVPRRDAFRCRASELQCRRHATNSRPPVTVGIRARYPGSGLFKENCAQLKIWIGTRLYISEPIVRRYDFGGRLPQRLCSVESFRASLSCFKRASGYGPTLMILVGSWVSVADMLSELSTVVRNFFWKERISDFRIHLGFPEREGDMPMRRVDCESHDCEISNHVCGAAASQEVI